MGEVYGFDKVFYEIVCRWRKKFLIGIEFVKDVVKFGWFVIVIGKVNVLKVREIIESDGRYMICDIVKVVGILLLWVYFILKCILKVWKIFVRWILYILIDD